MAGPDPERVSDDPRQAWIRSRWEREAPDARLPYPAGSDGAGA